MASRKARSAYSFESLEEDSETVTSEDIPVIKMRDDVTEEEIESLKKAIEEAPAPVIVVPSDTVMRAFSTANVTDEDVYDEIRTILSPQKGKRTVPTLVGFHSAYAGVRRYVIVDVNCELMKEAYECWKRHGMTDDEVFMDYVYKVLKVDVPRMFRAVAPLELK